MLDAGEGKGEHYTDPWFDGVLRTDNEYATVTTRRQAAAQAWLRHLTLEGIDRAKAARPRSYRGRCEADNTDQVYRRLKGVAEKSEKAGVWLGLAEVLATESSTGADQHFTDRVV